MFIPIYRQPTKHDSVFFFKLDQQPRQPARQKCVCSNWTKTTTTKNIDFFELDQQPRQPKRQAYVFLLDQDIDNQINRILDFLIGPTTTTTKKTELCFRCYLDQDDDNQTNQNSLFIWTDNHNGQNHIF